MPAKLCAVWLVVLIVLPFTAPFTTCERVNSAPLGAARDEATLAQSPALHVDDDAIVVSERTLAIQRRGPCVVAAGGVRRPIIRPVPDLPELPAAAFPGVQSQSAAVLRV